MRLRGSMGIPNPWILTGTRVDPSYVRNTGPSVFIFDSHPILSVAATDPIVIDRLYLNMETKGDVSFSKNNLSLQHGLRRGRH